MTVAVDEEPDQEQPKKYVVQGSATAGYIDDAVTEAVARLAAGQLGTREEVETEIDLMMAELRDSWRLEPDQVMRMCAAFSARCTELYVLLHRVEGRYREWRQVRTMQVDRLLAELDRQFKIASRLVEVRKQDLDQLRGF